MSWYESADGQKVWIPRDELVYTVVQPAADLPTEELMYLATSTQKAQFTEHTMEDDFNAAGRGKKNRGSGRQRGFLVRVEVEEHLRVMSCFKATCANLLHSVCSKIDAEESRNVKASAKRKAEKTASTQGLPTNLGSNECRVEVVGRCYHVACGPGFRIEVTEGVSRQKLSCFTKGKELSPGEFHRGLVKAIEATDSRVMLARRLGDKPTDEHEACVMEGEVVMPLKRDKAQGDEEAWLNSLMGGPDEDEKWAATEAEKPLDVATAWTEVSDRTNSAADEWFAQRMGVPASSAPAKSEQRTERCTNLFAEWGLLQNGQNKNGSSVSQPKQQQKQQQQTTPPSQQQQPPHVRPQPQPAQQQPPHARPQQPGGKGSKGESTSVRGNKGGYKDKGAGKGSTKTSSSEGYRQKNDVASAASSAPSYQDPYDAQVEEDRLLAQRLQEEEWGTQEASWAQKGSGRRAAQSTPAATTAWTPSLRLPSFSPQAPPPTPPARGGQTEGQNLLALLKGSGPNSAPESQQISSSRHSNGTEEPLTKEDQASGKDAQVGRWRNGKGKGPGARGRR